MLLGLAGLAGAAMWARVHHGRADRAWSSERARWTPQLDRDDGYAGSETCAACHPAAYASWHGSYHRTMTQRAGRDTIVAPWSGELPGGVSLRWTGARPEVVRTSPTGEPRIEPVVMTTGSHHLQLYWIPEPATGAVRAFEYAWRIDAQRFVPNAATLVRPAGDDGVYTWNRVCIRCHAVAGTPGWREGTGKVASEVVELGIACESCHGPAAAHVAARRNPWTRYLGRGEDPPSDIVQPRAMASDAGAQVCAQCHAITEFDDEAGWLAHGSSHAAGDPIADWGRLVRHPARDDDRDDERDADWLDAVLEADPNFLADRFWSDGMVRVTGREYNALVESPCAASGQLSCLSCHSLHDGSRDDQLRAGMDGDAACTQCHAAARYADVAHTHHAEGEGAGCMNCHLPRTTWGLLGAIRSHQVDTPDATISAETGRPNACNLCHLDRSLGWTSAWLSRWRGEAVEIPAGEPAAAATGVLAAEAGVRALWAWHLGWAPATAIAGSQWQRALLAEALEDPYAAVREVAWESLTRIWPAVVELGAPERGAVPDAALAERIRTALADAPADREGAGVLRDRDAPDREAIARWIRERDASRVVLAE